MNLGRLIFGAVVLQLLAGCSGSINPAKYTLASGNYAYSGEPKGRTSDGFDTTSPKRVARAPSKPRIRTGKAASVAQANSGDVRETGSVRSHIDPQTLPAAMTFGRAPALSSTERSIEDGAKEDPVNMDLRARTRICRGC